MPKGQSPRKPTGRRHSPENAAAVRMVRTLRAELGTEHGTGRRQTARRCADPAAEIASDEGGDVIGGDQQRTAFFIFVADPTTARWCTNRFRSKRAQFGISSSVGLAHEPCAHSFSTPRSTPPTGYSRHIPLRIRLSVRIFRQYSWIFSIIHEHAWRTAHFDITRWSSSG